MSADRLDGDIVTLRDLVRAWRIRADDTPGDASYGIDWENDDSGLLWTNHELTIYARQADLEASRRRPIRDNTTNAVCVIQVAAANGPVVRYHNSILEIVRAQVRGETTPLTKTTVPKMDTECPGWEGWDPAMPQFYVEEEAEFSLRLIRAPAEDLVLDLDVRRLAISSLRWEQRHIDRPETPQADRYALLDWMDYLAFQKRDSETYKRKASDEGARRFANYFGERPSRHLQDERRRERNLRRRVRGHYF
jgi:hypothetical protein